MPTLLDAEVEAMKKAQEQRELQLTMTLASLKKAREDLRKEKERSATTFLNSLRTVLSLPTTPFSYLVGGQRPRTTQ